MFHQALAKDETTRSEIGETPLGFAAPNVVSVVLP